MIDYRSRLREFPSAWQKETFCREVAGSPESFGTLLELALEDKDPVSWRAAWIVDGSAELDPWLADPHLSNIIRRLPDLTSTGTIRSLLRMLTRYEIPEEAQGMLVDLCFGYLVSELCPVAVKVHAMQLIYQHVLLYPELKDELITILEDQMDLNSVGFRSRSRRLIREMEKL